MYNKVNDNDCGWQHLIDQPLNQTALSGSYRADWLIIGGGYTGLAAAHRLAERRPENKTILLDAEGIGEGASARNSGFIVDSTLNDGQADHAAKTAYRHKYGLNLAGIEQLKSWVGQFNIDCDWDEAGKYHAAVSSAHFKKLDAFAQFLSQLGILHTICDQKELTQCLGTAYYQRAVHTDGGVLINPAKLSHGLAKALMGFEQSGRPMALFSHSPVLNLRQDQSGYRVQCPAGQVKASNVIVAVNAFMPRMGFKKQHVFPLTLSGGLTRPLNAAELSAIGQPKPWGVLSAHPMGVTMRLTSDKRILLRNTAYAKRQMKFNNNDLKANRKACMNSILKRFPQLPDLTLAHYWAGNVCISRNAKPVFERIEPGLFMAGCYNAGGIAMGSLFGQLIADYALGDESSNLHKVLQMQKANRLPPQPFPAIGVQATLAWRRFKGRSER